MVSTTVSCENVRGICPTPRKSNNNRQRIRRRPWRTLLSSRSEFSSAENGRADYYHFRSKHERQTELLSHLRRGWISQTSCLHMRAKGFRRGNNFTSTYLYCNAFGSCEKLYYAAPPPVLRVSGALCAPREHGACVCLCRADPLHRRVITSSSLQRPATVYP